MTTRPLIRIRPGAGFITILAVLVILNFLALAAQMAAVASYVWSLSHN